MRIGLYFGSFNPIHIGHLVMSNYMAHYTDLDQVLLVVTPQNPLKKKKNLLPDEHRLKMARLALLDNRYIHVSDIEFDLPQPNYTINTLNHLKEKNPDDEFVLIMGEDNLRTIHLWKDYEVILENYDVLVYPREITHNEAPNDHPEGIDLSRVTVCNAPIIHISSTFVRNAIQEQKDVRYLIPDTVINYISNNYFYE